MKERKLGVLCYVQHQGKTLLLHRNKKRNDPQQGLWIGLGGHIECGEAPHEAVIREAKEESGLLVKPIMRGVVTFADLDPVTTDWYAYVFTAADFSGKLIDSAEGELVWVPDQDVGNLPPTRSNKLMFEWFGGGKFFSAKVIDHKGEFEDYNVEFYR